MKTRPILFSAPMVRALLEGRKTQTRRVLEPQIIEHEGGTYSWSGHKPNSPYGAWAQTYKPDVESLSYMADCCPYGKPGDRLWVRETWAAHWMYDDVPPCEARSTHPDDNRWFAADPDGTVGTHGCPAQGRRGRWRRSINMPRWASRITLELTDVRVERLQDISEADTIAEGISGDGVHYLDYLHPKRLPAQTPRSSFYTLWDSIDGKGAWGKNPWVWALTFKLITV